MSSFRISAQLTQVVITDKFTSSVLQGNSTINSLGTGNITLYTDALLGGTIDNDPGGNANWTIDTASNIVSKVLAYQGTVKNGNYFRCHLRNNAVASSGYTVSVVAGTGVTLLTSRETLVEGLNQDGELIIVIRDITLGSEAVDAYFTTDTTGGDVATIEYVNNYAQGLIVREDAYTKSDPIADAFLSSSSTYDNGDNGAGATLTSTVNGAIPNIGGVAVLLTNRILVDLFTGANAYKNGVYTLTDAGSAGTPWVLTRAEDINGDPDYEIKIGIYVAVSNGDFASQGYVIATPQSELEYPPVVSMITGSEEPVDWVLFHGASVSLGDTLASIQTNITYPPASGTFMVGNGSDWKSQTTSQVKTTLGIGTNQLPDAPANDSFLIGSASTWIENSLANTKTLLLGDTLQSIQVNIVYPPVSGTFMVGDGSDWKSQTTAQVKTTLGIGTNQLPDAPANDSFLIGSASTWIENSLADTKTLLGISGSSPTSGTYTPTQNGGTWTVGRRPAKWIRVDKFISVSGAITFSGASGSGNVRLSYPTAMTDASNSVDRAYGCGAGLAARGLVTNSGLPGTYFNIDITQAYANNDWFGYSFIYQVEP